MTLNQVIQRITKIVTAHSQVRTFGVGVIDNILDGEEVKYPAVVLQDIGGNISLTRKATTLIYRLHFFDLVHVSEDTRTNEQDVISDMVSVAQDIVSQLASPLFQDWQLSTDNNLQLFAEDGQDMRAGCSLDFSISFLFTQNRCQIPSDFFDESKTYDLMYDLTYIATGDEGNTLTGAQVPQLMGKKILLITRENAPIYHVTNLPGTSEYTWNNRVIGLGAITGAGERFLILYRNY